MIAHLLSPTHAPRRAHTGQNTRSGTGATREGRQRATRKSARDSAQARAREPVARLFRIRPPPPIGCSIERTAGITTGLVTLSLRSLTRPVVIRSSLVRPSCSAPSLCTAQGSRGAATLSKLWPSLAFKTPDLSLGYASSCSATHRCQGKHLVALGGAQSGVPYTTGLLYDTHDTHTHAHTHKRHAHSCVAHTHACKDRAVLVPVKRKGIHVVQCRAVLRQLRRPVQPAGRRVPRVVLSMDLLTGTLCRM